MSTHDKCLPLNACRSCGFESYCCTKSLCSTLSPNPLLRPVAFSTMMRALITFPNLEKRRNKASLVMVLGMWNTNRLHPSGPALTVVQLRRKKHYGKGSERKGGNMIRRLVSGKSSTGMISSVYCMYGKWHRVCEFPKELQQRQAREKRQKWKRLAHVSGLLRNTYLTTNLTVRERLRTTQ